MLLSRYLREQIYPQIPKNETSVEPLLKERSGEEIIPGDVDEAYERKKIRDALDASVQC